MTVGTNSVDETPVGTGQKLIMYSTPWCGYCHRLKAQLQRAGIAYEDVDITDDPEATAFVEKINGGNQTVPTVRLPDGRAFTNPTITQLTAALASA
jgi:mycoredoxin